MAFEGRSQKSLETTKFLDARSNEEYKTERSNSLQMLQLQNDNDGEKPEEVALLRKSLELK